MFPPFVTYLKIVGLMIILTCIGVAFISPVLLQKNDIVAVVVAIIFGIPFTWLTIRLILAQLFIADQDTGIIDSIRRAWRITSDNFWVFLAGVLIFGVCSMVGTLFLYVGLILTLAIPFLGISLAYLQLTGEPYYLDSKGTERQEKAPHCTLGHGGG